jgi:hypothetical protein
VVVVLAVAAYAREPSTVAIVSLWATGVTMSLPAVLYLAAFGAIVSAVYAWLPRPETRHLGIAAVLLAVSGLQPQVLHHEVTAIVALTLLSLGVLSPHLHVSRGVTDVAREI